PKVKLLAQVFASLIVISLFGIKLDSFYGLFGIYDLPPFISYSLTLFTIIVITNSFNLIDGLDGLASTIGLAILFPLVIWFYLVGNMAMTILLFSLIGAILAFLRFNWAPSKIFMGDTGSLMIGFFLAVVVIYFINVNYNLPLSNPFRLNSSVGSAIALLIIPLYDTLRVFALRVLKKQSPFSPDKTHIHHILMRLGLNHSGTVRVMGFVNLLFVGLVVVGRNLGEIQIIGLIILLLIILSFVLNYSLTYKFPRRPKTRDLIKGKRLGERTNKEIMS
ncbi:MraY family glycosyltransferase, partial [Xanthovirga aplysinae]|uniref:MraY family glycosyltransferase n=1 Tax=Xanthovirga aplysinae TaxID=2529853 RepID=UPI0012BB55A7